MQVGYAFQRCGYIYYRIQLNKVVRKVPRVYTCTFLAPKGRQFQDPKDTFICQGMFCVYGGIVAKSILLIWEKREKFGSPLKRPGESIGQCCVHICTWRYIYPNWTSQHHIGARIWLIWRSRAASSRLLISVFSLKTNCGNNVWWCLKI